MQWFEAPPKDAVRLSVTAPLEVVEAAAFGGAGTIVLDFPAFRDGRGFSLAAVLRERGFRGQLIADGALLADQVRHLRRTGFDGVILGSGADVARWQRMDAAFSGAYQPAEDGEISVWQLRGRRTRHARTLSDQVQDLNQKAQGEDAEGILRLALDPQLELRPVVLSSFGAEAAVLLEIVARVDPSTPVIFLDTGMHFVQTLAYRRILADRLGLTDVRLVLPDPQERALQDPADDLWQTDADACCDLRKVRPLEKAMKGARAMITGRKRYQTRQRARLEAFEVFEERIRINPLLDWSPEQISARLESENLPSHPLVNQGFLSIGCWPCTQSVEKGADARSGRWSNGDKTECGIHLGRRVAT